MTLHIPRLGDSLVPEELTWKEDTGGYLDGDEIVLPAINAGSATTMRIPVPSGVPLIMAIDVKCPSFPGAEYLFFYTMYDAAIVNLGSSSGNNFCNSGESEWEEAVVRIPPLPPEVVEIVPKLYVRHVPDGVLAEVRAKDLYVGVGWGYREAPAEKKIAPELGFFPVMIYPTSARMDWSYYKTVGFNIVNQCNDLMARVAAADLYGCFTLDGYLQPGTNPALYGNLRHLREKLEAIDAAGHLDRVKMYHWDCENAAPWHVARAVSALLREMTPDKPIHMLSYNGVHRGFNDVADYASTYIAGDSGERFEGLHRNHNLRLRPGLAQINGLTDAASLRTQWYEGLKRGATGMCIYSDYRPAVGIPYLEETDWIDELIHLV